MRHGGSEDSGRPGRLAYLGLLCLFTVVALEGWRLSQVYLSVTGKVDVDVTSDLSSTLGVNELMVAVLARKRELVKVLGHINDRDGKVAFLERENQARERVLTAYSTVLKVRRDELARDTDHDTLEALIGQLKNKSSSFAHDLLLFDEKGPQERSGTTGGAPERTASQAQAQVEDVVIVSKREQREGGKGQPAAKTRVGEAADEVLLDAEKNEYVLSSPKDASERAIDKRLQLDLVVVIFASAAGGVFCSVVGLPVVLGYIAGGLYHAT
jgi:hypothetical protein